MREVPEALRWVLRDLDLSRVDAERDAPAVLARVLEHGRLSDVREALTYFEDAERDAVLPAGLTEGRWREIKAYFSREVPGLILA